MFSKNTAFVVYNQISTHSQTSGKVLILHLMKNFLENIWNIATTAKTSFTITRER